MGAVGETWLVACRLGRTPSCTGADGTALLRRPAARGLCIWLSKIRSGAALSDHEAVVPLQAAAARFTADAIGALSARGIKDARFLGRRLRRATPGQSRQGNGRVEMHADPLRGCAGRRGEAFGE